MATFKINEDLTNNEYYIGYAAKKIEQEGFLVYEYNPLRVFRTNQDIYKYKQILNSDELKDESGKIEDTEDYLININGSITYRKDIKGNIEIENGKILVDGDPSEYIEYQHKTEDILYPKNSIIDLDTELLSFDLKHPVDILTQESYDGSVNLILNDNFNKPRLVNTRFSPTGMNTYKVIDREGDNDTNIYDSDSFDNDISLYKINNTIVDLEFVNVDNGGNLKVGNYHFYFKLADADGNETDFVAESSTVSIFIGNYLDPSSVRGGIEDENGYKSVNFSLSNINTNYDSIIVYYTRTTSSYDGSQFTTAYKINDKYYITDTNVDIRISGYEAVTEVSLSEINVQYNLAEQVKAQVAVQNMLFFGNIVKPTLNYEELADISLHMLPHIYKGKTIGNVGLNYKDSTNKYEYYNPRNIYYNLGYWNNEIYRLGVVYILDDMSLSPVFNIRGTENLNLNNKYNKSELYNTDNQREYLKYDKTTFEIVDCEGDNAKGVVRISDKTFKINSEEENTPIGLKIEVNEDILKELLNNNIKGFFFVRQPRIKTIFCQAVTIGVEPISGLPVIKFPDSDAENTSNTYKIERFFNDDRILVHNIENRLLDVEGAIDGGAFICPEYEVNQAYYNQFFTTSEFTVSPIQNLKISKESNIHILYKPNDTSQGNSTTYYITAVADSVKYIKGKNILYSAEAGDAADATLFSTVGTTVYNDTSNIMVRGDFGPYLGVETQISYLKDCLVNIMIPGFNGNYNDYFNIRYNDKSSFQAISPRFDILRLLNNDYSQYRTETNEEGVTKSYINSIYNGDCYICNFTHRMCRNFQDSEAPNNDQIVDENTWRDHYRTGESDSSEERIEINRGDVNAVKMGHWITTKVCSSINLSLRCQDYSYPTEVSLTGHPRTFYPISNLDTSGNYKIPESFVHNSGYNKTLSDRYNFEKPDVPAIKNSFNTRILYSDIAIQNAFKNGFRVFRGNNYQDYSAEYGSIIKMLDWGGNIICVFEHGVAVIPVNERAIAANGAGGDAYINTYKVLPENPNVLSSTYGSQWADSVIKTPYGIYGVDTVAKKIWKVGISGSVSPRFVLSVISDFKVQRFLNENITLNELELEPILGIRNVKTHYNAFKQDIMFTFYDDRNTLNEKAWNLCYNEILDKFITFYSWIPSFSENIDNIFFSFDRTASKNILIGSNSDYSDISISKHNIVKQNPDDDEYIKIGKLSINVDTALDLDNITDITTTYELDDTLIKGFSIGKYDSDTDTWTDTESLYIKGWTYKQLYDRREKEAFRVPIIATVSYQTESSISQAEGAFTLTIEGCVYIYFDDFLKNRESTYFWKHGQAGLTKTEEPIKPCMWYGKQHPFEFEVVVVSNPMIHKMFTNLQLISNKVEPESLHFEITGEAYKFAYDKPNMYFRQEALKNLYQYYGADIVYNPDYLDIIPKQQGILYSQTKDRSTIFPLYYSRVDTINEIEDYYQQKLCDSKDYQMMSGSEIVHDSVTNEFKIATHIKACPFESRYKQLITEDYYKELIKNDNYKPFLIKETEIYRVHKEPNGNYRIFDDILDGEYKNTSSETYYTSTPITDIDNTSLREFIESFISEDDKGRNIYIYTFCENVKLGNDNDIGDWFWIKEDKLGNEYIPRTKHYLIMEYGRLNGNMNYQEDKWLMQIPSINYVQKNESDYGSLPPLNINYNPVPEDFDIKEFGKQLVDNKKDKAIFPKTLADKGYSYKDLQLCRWNSPIFETRIRDKYLKVRVRYTGNNLAIITALNTIFNISYA